MRDLVRASIIAISVLVASGGSARCDELVDAIDKAWRERAEKFKSARVNWTVTTTYVAGGMNLQAMVFGSKDTRKKLENGLQIPEQDVEVKSAHAMTLSGSAIRYDFDTVDWSHDTLKYYKKPCKSLSTSTKTISYQPDGLGSGDARTGFHSKEGYLLHALQVRSLPVTVHCLPCAKYYDMYAINRLGEISTKQLLNGIIELQCTRSKDLRKRLLCDSRRGYALTSIEEFNGANQLLDSFQIRYQDDPVLGSFPASWTSEGHNIRGKLVFRLEAHIDSYTINIPITQDDLEFELDRGTVVLGDEPSPYLVGDKGTKHQLSDAELMLPYGEMVKILEPKRSMWKRWTTYLPLAVIALMGVWVFVRKSRRVLPRDSST